MVKPRVVILGTGWGGNKLARMLSKTHFDVRVISPANHFLFTPMLPSTTVGTLEFRCIEEPIRTIPGLKQYYQAKAKALTTTEGGQRVVECEDIFKGLKFTVPYDYLVVSTGCKTNTFNIAGVLEREGKEVFFLKHLFHARQIRNRILECFERAAIPGTSQEDRERLLSFVVVGGGPTSCEFVMELHDLIIQDVVRWFPDLAGDIRISLVGPTLLDSFDQALVDYVKGFMASRKIDLRMQTAVNEVITTKLPDGTHSTKAVLSDGKELPFGTMVWSAGLSPVKFVGSNAHVLPTHGTSGRIEVDDYLRVKGQGGRVFAVGDCAVNPAQALPPLASVAEQQAEYLGRCFNESYRHQEVCDGKGGEHAVLPEPEPVAPASWPPYPPFLFNKTREFRYISKGSLLSLGTFNAIADTTKADLGGGTLTGLGAFLMWRGFYFSRQFSWSNMMLVPMFWFKTLVFGRDISRF